MKFKSGKQFLASVNKYVDKCTFEERIPNRAGYQRFFSISTLEFEQLCKAYKSELEIAEAIFEDEALNINPKRISPGILSLYLKSRFGYGLGENCEDNETQIICEHDAFTDGE